MTAFYATNDRLLFAGPLLIVGFVTVTLLNFLGVISTDMMVDVVVDLVLLAGILKIAVATRLMDWLAPVDSEIDDWHAKHDKRLFISGSLAVALAALTLLARVNSPLH